MPREFSADIQQQLIAAGPCGRRVAEQDLLDEFDAIEVGCLDARRAFPGSPVAAIGFHQPAQLPAALLDRFQPVILLGAQSGFANQPRHAEESVQDIPQFMVQFGLEPVGIR